MEKIIIKLRNKCFLGKLKQWEEVAKGTLDIEHLSDDPYTLSIIPKCEITKKNMALDDVNNAWVMKGYLRFLNVSLGQFIRNKREYEVIFK